MPVQQIELQEVTMVETSDEFLEAMMNLHYQWSTAYYPNGCGTGGC